MIVYGRAAPHRKFRSYIIENLLNVFDSEGRRCDFNRREQHSTRQLHTLDKIHGRIAAPVPVSEVKLAGGPVKHPHAAFAVFVCISQREGNVVPHPVFKFPLAW